MTINTVSDALANLTVLTFDQLAVVYGHCNQHAIDAGYGRSSTLWMNRRERVRAEISRRGLLIRRASDGGYMVGRSADFEPVG